MKKGSKRTIGSLLAGVMLVSTLFTNVFTTNIFAAANYTLWFEDSVAESGKIPAYTELSKDSSISVEFLADMEHYPQGDLDGHKAYRNSTKGNGATSQAPTSGNAIKLAPKANGVVSLEYYAPGAIFRYTQDTTGAMVDRRIEGITAMPYGFAVNAGYTYYIDTNKTSNLAFRSVTFIEDEEMAKDISVVPLDASSSQGDASIIFIDKTTGQEAARASSTDTSVKLLNGHEYTIESSDPSKEFLFFGKDSFVFSESMMTPAPDGGLWGDVDDDSSITKNDAVAILKFVLKNITDNFIAERADVNADSAISTKDATMVLQRALVDSYSFASEKELTKLEFTVENLLEVKVTGEITGTDASNVTSITFTNMNNAAVTKTISSSDISGSTYTVNLLPGDYKTSVVASNGFTTIDRVSVIRKSDVINNEIYLESPNPKFTAEVYKSVIDVPGDYDTLTDAMSAIKTMVRPAGEAITINLTADLQEQVNISESNLKINGNGHEITWYYSYGSQHYSTDSNGYYSEALFRDKFSKEGGKSSFWGGVVIVNGSNILMENLKIKNTFNYEVNDKQLEDGVEYFAAGGNGKWSTPEMAITKDTNVRSNTYRERANALAINGDNLEFYNCEIRSSQDTLGYNAGSSNHTYFKDCLIGGNTDYICGAGTMIFDNCTLEWFIEEGQSNLGYITAPKDIGPYLFRNCVITKSDNPNVTLDDSVKGTYGRPWGNYKEGDVTHAKAAAYFINTETNGTISDAGWTEMGGADPSGEGAKFYEYNNTAKGVPFKSTIGKDPTSEQVAQWSDNNAVVTSLLAGWTPVYLNSKTEDAPSVFILGDSTACDYDASTDVGYFYKRSGFGTGLKDYIGNGAKVVNLALSGRSSKNFAEGTANNNGTVDTLAVANYAKFKSDIKAGDYAIIAFAHNDEKADPVDAYRFTIPATTPGDYTQEGSFEKSLYDNYIKVAKDAGATPILATPIIRRNDSALSNNDLHNTPKGDYVAAIKALGVSAGVEVIDNFELSKTAYTNLTPGTAGAYTPATGSDQAIITGATGYAALHAASVSISVDNTHLNVYGAKYIASLMANDIKNNSKLAGLAKYVVSTTAPDKGAAHSMSYNQDWTQFDESVYVKSSIWKTSGDWDAAVFGNGTDADKITEDSHPNHDIVEITAGKEVQLFATANKGKIEGAADGFVMYFKEIPDGKDFELTAKATINNYGKDNQTAFGLIARDNVFTASSYKTSSDYALAGCAVQSSAANDVISRVGGSLVKDASALNSRDFNPGDVIDLKLSRTAGVFTAVVDGKTYTINNVDTSKVNTTSDFVGVCVTRSADVTFSDINLVLK